MSTSPFEKLKLSPQPVDMQAARVAFFRGERFEAEFTVSRPKIHLTLDYPPRAREARPAGARDYTGMRCGKMVAAYYFKSIVKSRKTRCVWVCRCDCGRYEFRKPCKWIGRAHDQCEICTREAEMVAVNIEPERKSKKTMPGRLMRWIHQLRAIGLTDDEICKVRQSNITITGMSASEVRALIG